MSEIELGARLTRLESAEEIKALKLEYADACDDAYNPDRIASLFTEDGVWDGGERYGTYEGRESIRTFFANVSDLVPWAMHYIVSPRIEVNEDATEADGRWYLWQTCNHYVGDELMPMMIAGRYRDRYRRESDGWKMSELHLALDAITPQLEGWAKKRFYDET